MPWQESRVPAVLRPRAKHSGSSPGSTLSDAGSIIEAGSILAPQPKSHGAPITSVETSVDMHGFYFGGRPGFPSFREAIQDTNPAGKVFSTVHCTPQI